MNFPHLSQFRKPEELMIIKYLAYLKKKEQTGLTPQEKDILYGTVHKNELCQILYTSECMRPWFIDELTININLFTYIAELVMREGYNITSDMLFEAVFVLLNEAYSKLLEPVNGIYTGIINSPCGDVIKCYDFTKPMNIAILNRIYVGYSELIAFALKNDINEEDILNDIKFIVRKYYINDDIKWIGVGNLTDYRIIEDFISNTSEQILMQLKKIYNY